MTELEVHAAFVTHLLDRGWDVHVDGPDQVDVVAHRGAETLLAAVLGDTDRTFTGINTGAALRVDPAMRRRLGINVYAVDDLGAAHRHGPE